jgi:L-2-hydroxyglutarate oxidase
LAVTDPAECERMAALEERCRQNGIETHRLGEGQLTLREPNILGMGAHLCETVVEKFNL